MDINKNILEKIVLAISKSAPDSEVYLYGSRSRGDFTKLSDWDLLILLNNDSISFSMETKLIDNLFEVELETGEVISPIIYSRREWESLYSATPLFENIEREGVKIK